NGSADPLHQGSTEGAEFPAPVPPEQSPPGLPRIETSGLEPAGPEATVIPVTSPESTLGAVSWMLPLVWLEKTLNSSFLVESLRHSLPLRKPQQDAGSSVTPVPTVVTGTSTTPISTVVTGTSITPVPTLVTGTSTTPISTVVTGTSITPVPTVVTGSSTTPMSTVVTGTSITPVPICPREHLKTLPRAELEGRLESTLIIIEALSLQLRDWQESQRPQSGVGPAKLRDALTQTDNTHPEGVRVLSEAMPPCPPQPRCCDSLSARQGTRMCLVLPVPAAITPVSLSLPQSTWGSQSLLFQGLADAAFRSLQDEQGALAQEQEQERTLVSQSQAVLESVPSKVQSCLEERDAIRQRVDE
ncbi:SPAG5 protein, partial [Sterrhoptilus dennistouni]|nr:SPAG5 protein [Sterrhoptilus dennistouni]